MSRRSWWLVCLGGVAGLATIGLLVRPLLPIDETRYASVAWEMWHSGQFLVPQLNGEAYDHKPPVLFWLLHLGWLLTGVNEWWPRCIGPAATLASLWLLKSLGRRLWPTQPGVGRLGSVMFLGTAYIGFYQTALMFDLPLLACIAAAWCALFDAVTTGRSRHWALFGLALGVGLVVKGPVVLAYTVPAAIGLRGWRPAGSPTTPRRGPVVALLVTLAVPALWLGAAVLEGSVDYFRTLLVDQTLHRLRGAMGHPRPWYWYLPFLLALPLPWLLWWPAWRGLRRAVQLRAEPGMRFVTIAAGAALLILALSSGKQVHYLIPIVAIGLLGLARALHDERIEATRRALAVTAALIGLAFLLLVAGVVHRQPLGLQPANDLARWLLPLLALLPLVLVPRGPRPASVHAPRVAIATLAFVGLLMAVVLPAIGPRYDLRPAAAWIAAAQSDDRPVAFVGKYQGEFGFLGRLATPLHELEPDVANAWIHDHPNGLVVARRKRLVLRGDPVPEYHQPYKSDELLMFRAADLAATGSALKEAHAAHAPQAHSTAGTAIAPTNAAHGR
jgi:4-amino-4-deoxy-L-arabinose transferase-like glycosyltransferase